VFRLGACRNVVVQGMWFEANTTICDVPATHNVRHVTFRNNNFNVTLNNSRVLMIAAGGSSSASGLFFRDNSIAENARLRGVEFYRDDIGFPRLEIDDLSDGRTAGTFFNGVGLTTAMREQSSVRINRHTLSVPRNTRTHSHRLKLHIADVRVGGSPYFKAESDFFPKMPARSFWRKARTSRPMATSRWFSRAPERACGSCWAGLSALCLFDLAMAVRSVKSKVEPAGHATGGSCCPMPFRIAVRISSREASTAL